MLLAKIKAILRTWLRGFLDYPQSAPAQIGAQASSIEDGAAQIVDRARQGDQNALALICQIRDNANKKNPRAMVAFKKLKAYIEKNPIKMQSSVSFGEEIAHEHQCDTLAIDLMDACFGTETVEEYAEAVKEKVPALAALSLPKAITSLSNGPSLLPAEDGNLFIQFAETYPTGPERNAFMLGMEHGIAELAQIPLDLQGPFLMGHILGSARKFQAARLPGVPLKVLGAAVGAEFGEG